MLFVHFEARLRRVRSVASKYVSICWRSSEGRLWRSWKADRHPFPCSAPIFQVMTSPNNRLCTDGRGTGVMKLEVSFAVGDVVS